MKRSEFIKLAAAAAPLVTSRGLESAAGKVTFEEFLKVRFIGHYNPRGNHFFAYSIKDTVRQWLDPKPITYRKADAASQEFKGYLNVSP